MNDRRDELIEQLRKAVEDPGRVPSFHIRTQRQHQREWPKLWEAIYNLLNETKRSNNGN